MHTEGSQQQKILAWLQAGHAITPLDALERFGCFRLGARCWALRQQGYDIQSEPFELPSGKRVARYWLPKGAEEHLRSLAE
jgi:hypothetical protein